MTEHIDVLIVGAGLSGIGAASRLKRDLPGKTFLLLESRGAIGGTWDLFRYPGVRSDSDMYTLGYSFRPWTDAKAIADGDSIRDYIRATVRDEGLEDRIRLHHRVLRADWSSATALWTVTAVKTGDGEFRADTPIDGDALVTFTCSFLSVCSGYYRYDEGFTPAIPGADSFEGALVHPQHWPADLDYEGKRVVIVGSGATAVTLVPSMARTAARVTMLQRSPTYISPVPSRDHLADRLRGKLPAKLAYDAVRVKNIGFSMFTYQLSRRQPEKMKAILKSSAKAKLPADFDVDRHLTPTYEPWDQRLCAIPNGDLYRAISKGTADIVTDRIRTITPTGIDLESGASLEADVIVTATGLNLLVMGGMSITVDGEVVDVSKALTYKGMMIAGVPNFSLTIGYTNASWTLKADLVATYVTRLIKRMDRHHRQWIVPVAEASVGEGDLAPLIDLKAGYVLRDVDRLPKQGDRSPWRLHQNYLRDFRLLRAGRLTDDVVFGRRGTRVPSAVPLSTGARADGNASALGSTTARSTTANSTTASVGSSGAPATPDPLALPHTAFVVVDGTRLRYRSTGQGAPLLLLHGIGQSLDDWTEQHELLAARHRVISVDLPGFAYSQRRPGTATLKTLASILPAFLDALDVRDPVPVIGNSLGGAVAMAFAAAYPSRVSSLVLADSAGFGSEVTMVLRLLAIKPLGSLLMRPKRSNSQATVEAVFYDKKLATAGRVERAFQISRRRSHVQTTLDLAHDLGTIRGVSEAWRTSLLARLRGLGIPTLVVWGDHDHILPFSHLAAAEAALPGVETHVFTQTGHMPQIEKPDEFAAVVEEFLARQGASAGTRSVAHL